jgi:hypothetical protein
MDEDLETVDELEIPAGDVTDEALEDLEGVDDGEGRGDAPTENKWAARRSLSEMLEEADEAAKPKPDAPKRPTADGEDEEDEEEEQPKPKDGQEPKKPESDAKPDADKAKGEKARYTVKGADGKSFEFRLEPGTSIQFKGDGRDVEVKSMDELVQLAQKGAAFDRKTTEQGQRIGALETRERTLADQLTATRTAAEQTLLAALFDEEKAEALRKALEPYRDPKFREGQEAIEREAQRKTKEKETEEQTVESKRTEFWQGVGSDIKAELAGGKFEHLTSDDAMEIATRFHAGYAQAFTSKFAELKAAGTPEATAHQQANSHAFSHFTEKNLRRVMRGLNAELAEERAAAADKAKATGAQHGKSTNESSAKAAADAHNKTGDRYRHHDRGRSVGDVQARLRRSGRCDPRRHAAHRAAQPHAEVQGRARWSLLQREARDRRQVANVGDGGMLPRPSRPKNKTGKSSLCHTYTVVAVGGQSVPLTEDTRNAFVSNLENQLEDGMTRVQNDLERQYNGDGLGILCTLLTVGARRVRRPEAVRPRRAPARARCS